MGREDGPLIIIGVDPGDTTGIAIWRPGTQLTCAQLNPLSVVPALRPHVTARTLVACETFVIGSQTAKKSRSSHVTDVIGRVMGLCEECDARFKRQTASEAKTFAVNALLKRVGWWQPGLRHAMDAARHALLALARENPRVFDEMIKNSH